MKWRASACTFGGPRMANIIAFKAAPKPTQASVLASYGSKPSAEIVFFPGVRYERQADDPPDMKPKKPRHRRDRIDIDGKKTR